MRIGDRSIGPDQPPYVIAEIGVNHDGDPARALELIDAAADANADAVKFQCFDSDLLLSSSARFAAYQKSVDADDPAEMLRRLQLSYDELTAALAYAHGRQLHGIVTVFSPGLVDSTARAPWDAWKTASPDGINKPLIDALTGTGRPLLLSTGTMTLDEVARMLIWVRGNDIALLHCVSAYPTPDHLASLGGIRALQEALEVADRIPVGYSDHTGSIDTGAIAVASGACILEKHLTYDTTAAGPDHSASIDPDQMREYVAGCVRAHQMLGGSGKQPLAIEDDVRTASRQSIVTTRALSPGHVLTEVDLTVKRPGTGIEPWRIEEIVGRTIRRDVDADVPLKDSDLT